MIQSVSDGVIVSIRVIPRATRSGVEGIRGAALLVRLRAPALEGAANAELIDVLTERLEVPRRAVTIVGGERSRRKRVHIGGLDASTAASRLL
jgi:uncharacterized protein (TIGR00251 family)